MHLKIRRNGRHLNYWIIYRASPAGLTTTDVPKIEDRIRVCERNLISVVLDKLSKEIDYDPFRYPFLKGDGKDVLFVCNGRVTMPSKMLKKSLATIESQLADLKNYFLNVQMVDPFEEEY